MSPCDEIVEGRPEIDQREAKQTVPESFIAIERCQKVGRNTHKCGAKSQADNVDDEKQYTGGDGPHSQLDKTLRLAERRGLVEIT